MECEEGHFGSPGSKSSYFCIKKQVIVSAFLELLALSQCFIFRVVTIVNRSSCMKMVITKLNQSEAEVFQFNSIVWKHFIACKLTSVTQRAVYNVLHVPIPCYSLLNANRVALLILHRFRGRRC